MSADKKTDPAWAWAAYQPSDAAPWDVRRAGHLLRRAGFGCTLAEAGPRKSEISHRAQAFHALANYLTRT